MFLVLAALLPANEFHLHLESLLSPAPTFKDEEQVAAAPLGPRSGSAHGGLREAERRRPRPDCDFPTGRPE